MRAALFITLTCGQALMATQEPLPAYEGKKIDFTNQPYHSYSEYMNSRMDHSSGWYKACAVAGVTLGVFAAGALSDGFGGGSLSPTTFLITGAAGTATYFIYDIANN